MAKKGNATSASPQGRDSAAPLRKKVKSFLDGPNDQNTHTFLSSAFWASVVRAGLCTKQDLATAFRCAPSQVYNKIDGLKNPNDLRKQLKSLDFGTN